MKSVPAVHGPRGMARLPRRPQFTRLAALLNNKQADCNRYLTHAICNMSIATEIYHLKELPTYAAEKPYTMRYVPDGEVAVTNVQREKHLIKVKDMRDNIANNLLHLNRNGFTMSPVTTKMSYEDYDDPDKIINVYVPALEDILLTYFPGSTIDFVSYLVSLA